jgi:photosystem II stability/assembly factor-like uncharacterized protein
MLRMAPQAAQVPSPTPTAGPGPANAAAGAASPAFAAKQKALVAPAKGRIEKGTLQLSTDGGATWHNITTPEPVLAFQISDALSFEIRTRSLAVFRTKDGGKTWQAEKPPQP